MCWTTSVRASARHATWPGSVAWAHRCLTWAAEAADGAAEAANALAVSGPPDMSATVDSRPAAAEPARRLRLSPCSEAECSALECKELPFCVEPIEIGRPA